MLIRHQLPWLDGAQMNQYASPLLSVFIDFPLFKCEITCHFVSRFCLFPCRVALLIVVVFSAEDHGFKELGRAFSEVVVNAQKNRADADAITFVLCNVASFVF